MQEKDEMMNSKTIRILVSGLLVALTISAVCAGSAAASPAWKFDGVELESTELTVGFGIESDLTMPIAPIKCEHFLYKMKISNSGGTGKGEVTELPLFDCTSTNPECTVESIEAEKLPWPVKLTTIKGNNYLIIENVKISVLYGGASCLLEEVIVTATGSAGASFENASEAAVFDEASYNETKTGLKALGSPVFLLDVFPTEAFEWHREQALAVS